VFLAGWEVASEGVMRGSDAISGAMFSYVDAEARVPKDHPLRTIRGVINAALVDLWPEFERLYSRLGRPSIPPERLLWALLLQAFYSVRSERQLMEQLDYNLLFRWFVGLGIDDPVWDVTVYTKNRDRLLGGEVAARFMAAVLGQPEVKALLSDEHFSVDGTLVEAWASLKSFRAKDGNGEPPGPGRNRSRDFHGEKRTNATHASTTDPQARLFRKGPGKEAKLSFMGHLLMENRSGLVVNAGLTEASAGPNARLRSNWSKPCPADIALRLAPTRRTMRPPSLEACVGSRQRRTSPSASRPTGARTSTAGRRAMPAMASASGRESGSRRPLAG
jgi:transposase